MDKRKTGIALFITLMVIASIMSIIAVSFSYLEKVQKDAGKVSALIQANLLYGNTVDKLKQIFPKGTDNSAKFALFYDIPIPISEEKIGFSLTITCHALVVAPPLAWLDEEKTKDVPEKTTLAKQVLEHIINLYEIVDPNGLEKILLQSIKGNSLGNPDYSQRFKVQNGIVSKQQFDMLIIDYALKYDDSKALNIPWEKYFSFLKVNSKTKIDGAYLSSEFLSVAFDIPIEIINDSWIRGTSTLNTFLKDNAIVAPINKKIYTDKALNAMHCKETFVYKERQYGFQFNYTEGRSSSFEFNGQQ